MHMKEYTLEYGLLFCIFDWNMSSRPQSGSRPPPVRQLAAMSLGIGRTSDAIWQDVGRESAMCLMLSGRQVGRNSAGGRTSAGKLAGTRQAIWQEFGRQLGRKSAGKLAGNRQAIWQEFGRQFGRKSAGKSAGTRQASRQASGQAF